MDESPRPYDPDLLVPVPAPATARDWGRIAMIWLIGLGLCGLTMGMLACAVYLLRWAF